MEAFRTCLTSLRSQRPAPSPATGRPSDLAGSHAGLINGIGKRTKRCRPSRFAIGSTVQWGDNDDTDEDEDEDLDEIEEEEGGDNVVT